MNKRKNTFEISNTSPWSKVWLHDGAEGHCYSSQKTRNQHAGDHFLPCELRFVLVVNRCNSQALRKKTTCICISSLQTQGVLSSEERKRRESKTPQSLTSVFNYLLCDSWTGFNAVLNRLRWSSEDPAPVPCSSGLFGNNGSFQTTGEL